MIRVALAIITDQGGQIFLQHRDGKAPTNPNKWGLWGGRIEGQETPEEALIRELKEELAIDVEKSDLQLFEIFEMKNLGTDWVGYVHHLKDVGGFNYILGEGDDMKYFSTGDLESLDIDPIAKKILNEWILKSEANEKLLTDTDE